jgi:hypothetical protein
VTVRPAQKLTKFDESLLWVVSVVDRFGGREMKGAVANLRGRLTQSGPDSGRALFQACVEARGLQRFGDEAGF